MKDTKFCPNKENLDPEKFNLNAISPETEKIYMHGFWKLFGRVAVANRCGPMDSNFPWPFAGPSPGLSVSILANL